MAFDGHGSGDGLSGGVWGRDESPPAANEEPPAASENEAPSERPHGGIDMNDVALCSNCHANIADEWMRSMHSQAHASADPIFGAMRTLRTAREGADTPSKCANCHGPREPSQPDGDLAVAGVTCATCHQLEGVDRGEGRHGARALQFADAAVVRGPHGLGDVPSPHFIGEAAPWITDGQTLCRACHDATQNSRGVAACTTGPEYDEGLREAGVESTRRGGARGQVVASAGDLSGGCTGCHMPMLDTPSGGAGSHDTHRSHEFFGPHHLWREGDAGREFMASAVALAGRFEGDELVATIENRTGHGMPSAFPGRMVLLKVVGLDAAGEQVWTNFTDNPPRQDPQSVFNKVYLGDDGRPTLAAYGAEIARDNRLDPAETRTLRWDEVPETVARVRFTLLFRLVPPPLAERLGLTDSPLGEARPFVTLEVSRAAASSRNESESE